MWKNDRFFEQRKKACTPKIAAALLKNGKAKVKGLYSEKTGKTYDATVLLADTGGKLSLIHISRLRLSTRTVCAALTDARSPSAVPLRTSAIS